MGREDPPGRGRAVDEDAWRALVTPSVPTRIDGESQEDYAARCRDAQHHGISGGLLANVATKTVTMRFDTTPILEAMERTRVRVEETRGSLGRWTATWTATDTGATWRVGVRTTATNC